VHHVGIPGELIAFILICTGEMVTILILALDMWGEVVHLRDDAWLKCFRCF